MLTGEIRIRRLWGIPSIIETLTKNAAVLLSIAHERASLSLCEHFHDFIAFCFKWNIAEVQRPWLIVVYKSWPIYYMNHESSFRSFQPTKKLLNSGWCLLSLHCIISMKENTSGRKLPTQQCFFFRKYFVFPPERKGELNMKSNKKPKTSLLRRMRGKPSHQIHGWT